MVEPAGNISSVLGVVLQVGKWLAAPVGRQFMYLYNNNTNFKNLEKEVDKLKNTRDEVQRRVTAAERNVEEIKQNVKDWQRNVDSIIGEADQLILANANNPRCFKGLCPNLKTSYKHSKKAFKLKRNDIDPLLQQEKEFDQVSHPIIPLEIWLRTNQDYLAFESRQSTEKSVWEALKDENIYMIGVYGMGGLGKTTLVQEIGRKAEKDNLFDEIIFVEVTETLNIKKVQAEIADKLGVIFNNESERAIKLYERLNSSDKILLILDNIWEELDLKTIGIPSETYCGGCKIMLTTRNLDVLQKMDSTSNFGMGILKEEEAWNLFMKMAGNAIQTLELNSLPKDVCKECGGLPIVVCTIAKALRNRSQKSQWEDALRVLRMPPPTKFARVLEKELSKIKLSYDYLEDDELKKTFLISSLMENDTSISELLKNIISLGILEGANLTIEQAWNRLDLVVKELKDSCLLLDGSTRERFSMHDVVRIVAVTCAYIDHHVFTERNDVEREWKDKDKLRKCTIISLVGSNNITQLWPEGLDCPELEFFNMSKMASPFEIPTDFFTAMPKLKVLNLCRMNQLLLPSSLDLPVNLQTLCLDGSNIEDVAIIGKLRKLKVLSLRHSYIKELPIEICQLTQLKILDLSNCCRLNCIAPNVISKLSQLEELYITECPIQWKVEIIEEFKHFTHLTTLKLDIEDDIVLPQGFFSRELKRYEISTGGLSFKRKIFNSHDWLFDPVIKEHKFTRVLKLIFNSTISSEDLQEMKNVEFLSLAELSNAENGLYNSQMRSLFEEQVIFPDLKVLVLIDINARKIWDSQLPTSSYQNLTKLTLLRCEKIKYVFPSSIAKSLQQLSLLKIKDCQVLEEIVAKEEGANAVVNFVFPNVTILKLRNLPQLIAFYPEIHTLELPMLEDLVVTRCNKFASEYLSFQENNKEGEAHISEPKSLFLDNKIYSDLEVLELKNKLREIEWWRRFKTLKIKYDKSANIPLGLLQIFENLEKLHLYYCGYKEILSCGKAEKHMQINIGPSSASFQNLKVLRMHSCNEVMNLITPSMVKSLVQLRVMSIQDCEMVIEIVENEGDAITSIEIVFDNLKHLSLKKLESLSYFCSGNYSFNFPSLEELIIGECPNMKTFSRGILATPKLSKVNYKSLKNRLPKVNYKSWNESYQPWEEMEVENKGNDLNTTIQGLYKKQDISLDLKFWTFKDINSTEICYNQHPTSFYQNLMDLLLWNCGNIKYVFPSSIAKSLHQLQHLKIQNCKLLEEIVAKEEGANAIVKFVFPHLTSLKLKNLPEFIAFYHTFEWPMLKELVVINCDKFMTSKYLSFQENNKEGELHFSEPKSLFLNDKINSDLEELQSQNKIKNITWQNQSKTLVISHDKSANFPLGLLQRFENLKELQLSWCEYKEIFTCRKDEKHTRILTKMQIRSLFDLTNLEVLHVKLCTKLLTLVPSSASFQNLIVLSVYSCNGLIKLITPSTARSLVQLRELSIEFCTMVKEIVENKGEGDATTSTDIVFDNLKKISFVFLESLICFCSGNYSFNFPYLEELII